MTVHGATPIARCETSRAAGMPLLVPSCILAVDKSLGLGGLFHGGFKAVMNVEFLKKEMVTHIVNTAKGLEYFGPKYLVRTCQMYIRPL